MWKALRSVFRLSPLLAALWLASCGTDPISLPATISVPTWTGTFIAPPAILLPATIPSPGTRPTITLASRPSLTPIPSPSPILGPLITRTPAPPAECPPPGNPAPIQASEDPELLTNEIERFLDEGGSAAALRESLREAIPPPWGGWPYVLFHVEAVDVTGDTTPDYVVSIARTVRAEYDEAGGPIMVLACQQGGVVALLNETYFGAGSPVEVTYILTVDLNGNGVPELVYIRSEGTPTGGANATAFIREWDGSEFRQLIAYPGSPGYYDGAEVGGLTRIGQVSFSQEVLTGEASSVDALFPDADGNGTREFIVEMSYGEFRAPAAGLVEEEYLLETWGWNGEAVTLRSWGYGPSPGRYYVVKAGDEAFEQGDLETAVGNYWYEARNAMAAAAHWLSDHPIYSGAGAPPPDKPSRNPLTVYAQFRLLLTYASQGLLDDAKEISQLMHDSFSIESPDQAYVEMADLFYAEFLRTSDLSAACRAAVEFAREHEEEILTPLRSDRFGSLYFKTYTPRLVCPIG